MVDHAYYCPACFVEIEQEVKVCPACGINIEEWEKNHDYFERLVHSLKHPNPEARMGCILTLGNQRNPKAAVPLAECAFAHSIDVWQAMEIIRSLRKISNSSEKETALKLLLEHPAVVIREEAQAEIDRIMQT